LAVLHVFVLPSINFQRGFSANALEAPTLCDTPTLIGRGLPNPMMGNRDRHIHTSTGLLLIWWQRVVVELGRFVLGCCRRRQSRQYQISMIPRQSKRAQKVVKAVAARHQKNASH
jgi:hypothetical protein